jgi:hypothetical protein
VDDLTQARSGLGSLATLANITSRSISAENPDGAPGGGGRATEGTGARAARDLGQGWKVSPCLHLKPGDLVELATIAGPGIIKHIWITTDAKAWRSLVLRMYWENDAAPAIEVPLGDFFANGWCEYAPVNSLPISVNSIGGLNSYWEMPFRDHARITIEYRAEVEKEIPFFYQIDYHLTELPDRIAYFHAIWNRNNPLPDKVDQTLLEQISGKGQYVGTYIAWGANNNGWWGEGEVKFFIDDDRQWPTICGTGTEDYFGGAWCFWDRGEEYKPYTTPYLGFHQVLLEGHPLRSQARFGMYRWHIPDPVYFNFGLRVTIQAIGWRSGGRYLPLQDDIASTVFLYHERTSVERAPLPDADALEVI